MRRTLSTRQSVAAFGVVGFCLLGGCGDEGMALIDGGQPFARQAEVKVERRPFCDAIGTRSEGWYWQDSGEWIQFSFCAQRPEPTCDRVATKAQGWYSETELVAWDSSCHRLAGLSLEGELCGGVAGLACHAQLYCHRSEGAAVTDAGICRAIGSCEVKQDCRAWGNAWMRPMCIGWDACEEGRCTWHCGAGPSTLSWR